MSSGMNVEQAKEYAKTMTYSEAVSNVRYSKGIKYRKATMIKLRELAEIADRIDRKTENSSEKPNNCKDEPKTQMKTQNSNLTFEKRTMRDCYNCKRYETEGECIECHFEPKDEPQTRSEGHRLNSSHVATSRMPSAA